MSSPPETIQSRFRLKEALRPSDLHVTLVWAGLIGLLGACSSIAFRAAIRGVQWLFWREDGELVLHAAQFPAWQRLLIPALGGALAGLVLQFGRHLARGEPSTDYLEAVAVGEGTIRVRPSLVKSLSSLCTISSGGSIGREGVMVQLASMLASWVGRFSEMPAPRLRLMVACGAAAGIASAYNAPIAGALFVSEIALGSIAMESLGPLVFASVIATATTRALLGPDPLFVLPQFQLVSGLELVPYLGLGIVVGLAAPLFVGLLRQSERGFARLPLPLWSRLMLGGLAVGLLSLARPEVWGNGYSAVSAILAGEWGWRVLLAVLACKLAATAATVGSGAVGGVFTPTLFAGAACGYLYGLPVHALAPDWTGAPSAYALVGMGSFLAAATQAPLMSMLILFEMTLDYGIVLPLMLACVTAWSVARGLEARPIYAEALRRKRTSLPGPAQARVRDLMKPAPLALREDTPFRELVRAFLSHRHNYIYVTDPDGRLLGAVSLHDIKTYMHDEELTRLVIARDFMRDDFPSVEQDASLGVALQTFLNHDGERLPVIDGQGGHMLVGSISKTDLLLSLSL